MKDMLSIEISQWLSREYGSVLDKTTLAEIAISTDDHVATELEDFKAKTIRLTARLSAYEMAEWFAANWWRLLWEPEKDSTSWKMSHKLGAVGGGYLWPDLSFRSDGVFVEILSRATSQEDIKHGVRYLNSFKTEISVASFEKSIASFIDDVIARLTASQIKESELYSLWKEVQDERKSPEVSNWRKLEAILGFDPGEADEALIEKLKKAELKYGPRAVEEMAAYSEVKAHEVMTMLWDEKRVSSTLLKISHTEALRDQIQKAINTAGIPWKQAEKAAKIVRKNWDINNGPITTKDLCNALSVSEDVILKIVNTDAPISVGFRDSDSDRLNIFLNRRGHTSRRFALARLVGDHIITAKGEKLLPATSVETWRQKYQRAFAQELLCPYDELESYLGSAPLDEDLIEETAVHFDVSPLLVRTTLVNKGRLDRSSLLDQSLPYC